jgi:ATP-dependent DNA helicase RecG
MEEFARNRIGLLVCTTVIEVGVDVPNACLMVIESAERFGLAQLHQLRGRVGRGTRDSVCILLFGERLSDGARRRLQAIYETSDGFRLSELDLQLRGEGELLGERQSGEPLLRFADLHADGELVAQAQAAALQLIDQDPAAARRHARRWLGSREELTDA